MHQRDYILGVLGVWSLANGRLERPNNRGYVQANGRLQRWNSKGRGYVHANGRLQHWKHRLTATGLGGTAKAHRRAW